MNMASEPNESHYHSKKDRIFVRAIQGHYNLKEELARLRSMPRVRKGREIKFTDGPQTFSRHYVEPKDGITQDRKSTRLNSSHSQISYAVFCLKKKKKIDITHTLQKITKEHRKILQRSSDYSIYDYSHISHTSSILLSLRHRVTSLAGPSRHKDTW